MMIDDKQMERFSWWKVIGIILAVAGVFIIVAVPLLTSDTDDDASAFGAMLFTGNTLSFSVGLIFTKQILAAGM
jgi:drug/metabolite transporter (DMT)-like permease